MCVCVFMYIYMSMCVYIYIYTNDAAFRKRDSSKRGSFRFHYLPSSAFTDVPARMRMPLLTNVAQLNGLQVVRARSRSASASRSRSQSAARGDTRSSEQRRSRSASRDRRPRPRKLLQSKCPSYGMWILPITCGRINTG